MKRFAIAVSIMFLTITTAHAQVNPLRVTTERQQKTHRDIKQRANTKDIGGGWTKHTPEVAEQSQSVVMDIKIQNMSAKDFQGLTVKYVVFSKDKVSNKVKDAGRGEKKVDLLKSLQTATVETEPVEFASEEKTFRNGYFSELNARKGEQYYGIAIAAYVGSNKIASYYEPGSLEQQSRKLGVEP